MPQPTQSTPRPSTNVCSTFHLILSPLLALSVAFDGLGWRRGVVSWGRNAKGHASPLAGSSSSACSMVASEWGKQKETPSTYYIQVHRYCAQK